MPMTLREIAAELRKLYPDAISVDLFVNEQEHTVEINYDDKSGPGTGATYKRLDGKWSHEERKLKHEARACR